MLYVHPPLAILGHVFIVMNFVATMRYISSDKFRKQAELTGLCAWAFVLSGMVSGMVWAQIAWGSYWSWDPKETSTLALYLATTCYLFLFYKRKKKLLICSNVLCIALSLLTLFSARLWGGLH